MVFLKWDLGFCEVFVDCICDDELDVYCCLEKKEEKGIIIYILFKKCLVLLVFYNVFKNVYCIRDVLRSCCIIKL